MIMRRMFAATLLTMLCLAEGSAEVETKAARDDSLVEKTERTRRIAKKLVAGSLASVASAAIIAGALNTTPGLGPEPGTDPLTFGGDLAFLFGLLPGTMFGFPVGVTLVDPHDFFRNTLRGGIGGGLAGLALSQLCDETGPELLSVLGFVAIYVGPVVGSIYESEQSRNPPQAHRVSFGLAPTAKGSLFAVATLRF